jgi:hydroxyacylglutathione hydrolase
MYLKRFYDDNLAHASYLVGCQASGEAIVIDPSREVSQYLEEAKSQGLTINAVTETHVHADYLSGSRQLAHETNARMYLSKEGGKDWQYQFAGERDVLVGDGYLIKIGNLTLEVMHTPGHTPEHISFILTDHPASDKPIGAFTGDFVFVGDVGRPDLLEKAAGIKDTMKKGAAELYESLQRFKVLPDHLQIWPAHGAGSACGKALGAVPSSVLGYEKIVNWAFRCKTKEEFVQQILDGQPEPPKYFAEMKRLNKVGPPLLPTELPTHLDATKLQDVQTRSTLIDLRGVDAFVKSHPRRALFLPADKSLVTWAGWLLSYQEDLHLLVNEKAAAVKATRALRSIGLDRVKGYFLDDDLQKTPIAMQSSQRIEASQVNEESQNILDVRSQKEWDEGHLKNAQHIHLGYLQDHFDEVPENPVLHCRSGLRSLIASSLLQRAGKQPVDILGGYSALKEKKEAAISS